MTGRLKYVYFVKPVGSSGPIKIGCSGNPEARARRLGREVGVELEVIAAFQGGFMEESQLHWKLRQFKDCETFGGREWFQPQSEVLSFAYGHQT